MSDKHNFQCSVSVIPIVDTKKLYIEIIQKSMQEVIPYIEELTQVRYYPVTTYVVDYCTSLLENKELIECKRNDLDFEDIENEFSDITKEMHTYGAYLYKNRIENIEFTDMLSKNEFPESINQVNTGKVLICINRITERAEQLYRGNPSIDKELLIKNLVTATLIHEHTHAANFEGIRYNYSEPLFLGNVNKNDYKYDIVFESLAEWSEFNYFRDNDVISKIIDEHINGGEIKKWPYAGAALIERRFNELGIVDFQAIFDMSRESYMDAYEILSKNEI